MSLLTDTLRPEEGTTRPLGTVVHIGAGSGLVLADYMSLQPQALVLVEGDPDTAAELRDLAATLPWVRVVEAVAAPTAGPATWHRYNLPALNGLAGPERLREDYPRLRLLRQHTVQAQAVADILATLRPELNPDTATEQAPRHALVIDLPACAEDLASMLTEETLAPFETVLLRTAVRLRTDGEGEDHPSNWQAHLRQAGFTSQPAPQRDEGPGDHWVAGRPIKAVPRIPSAAERVAELEVELALAEEALQAEKARAVALETSLAESQAASQARQATQTSALAAANTRISELEDALAQRPSDTSPSQADLAERLEDAVARLQKHLTLNHRLMHDMQQLQAREQELQRRLTVLQSERDDVRKQLSLALEAQVIRENSVLELHRGLAGFLKRNLIKPESVEDDESFRTPHVKATRLRPSKAEKKSAIAK
jgi:hypothetical protein